MDFTLTEEQLAAYDAAHGLFSGVVTTERLVAIERSDERFDAELWRQLASADLLGLVVPVAFGGGGLGLSELCMLLEAQGRHLAQVPIWATLAAGALPVARFGSDELKQHWLPKVASGDAVLTAALTGVGSGDQPGVVARRQGDGWSLRGTAFAVPYGHVADSLVVPAMSDDGMVVLMVDPHSRGVTVERAITTNREVHPHIHFDGCAVSAAEVLAGPADGGAAVAWMLQVGRTGLCAIQLGVTGEALRRTAGYLNQRHQFGRPLSSFQAALLRAADAAIDIDAIRLTLWQAAWRIDTGRDASEAVAVAKWQASERGQRVVHATQHLHGGIGADITYPIHRYFLWGKQIELLLGSSSEQLAELGAIIAGETTTAGAVA